MAVQIQLRNGTAAQWTSANPTLAVGEIGVETDTGKFKVGNGSTAWSSLTYSSGIQGPAGTNGTNGTDGNTILNGAGAPSNAVGANGDYYLDTTNTVLYGPKAAGAWPGSGVSLKGSVTGSTGSTDNAILRADGTGGATLQASAVTISDTGDVQGMGSASTVKDSGGTAYQIGYRQVPQNAQTGTAYTLALSDDGKHAYFTGQATATVTVPTNASVAFPIGSVITLVNGNSGNLTVSGPTNGLQLANGSLASSRTVATKGVATLLKVATDLWYVSGSGVS